MVKSESQKKYKKSTAVRFVKERLSELRAEERRRVCLPVYVMVFIDTLLQILGLRPCKDFAVLRCDEFVDKFLPFLKVEKEAIPNYKLHVAVLVCIPAINVFTYLLYESTFHVAQVLQKCTHQPN